MTGTRTCTFVGTHILYLLRKGQYLARATGGQNQKANHPLIGTFLRFSAQTTISMVVGTSSDRIFFSGALK